MLHNQQPSLFLPVIYLSGANLRKADLYLAKLDEANLVGADINGTKMPDGAQHG